MQLEAGVRATGIYDTRSYDHVGVFDRSAKGRLNQFSVGAYGFSNPYSANMFSYIYRRWGYTIARSTVELFEKELKRGAAQKFLGLMSINWGDVVARNWSKALDWESTVRDLAIAAGGWAVTQLRLSGALSQLNPNLPSADQEQYVAYAIAYWGRNPSAGPAYQVLSYNIR